MKSANLLVPRYMPYSINTCTKLAINIANRTYGDQKFLSKEPITYHLRQTADNLFKWKMEDPTIAAGILHRFNPEELKKKISDQEKCTLDPSIKILEAFRTLRDFQPLEMQNLLTPSKLVESNYCKMLLKHVFDKAKFSEEDIFKALIVKAADELSTLKSAGIGYWDIPININAYSSIAASTASLLMKIGLENIAGEIWDTLLQSANQEQYKRFIDIYQLHFGSKIPLQKDLLKIKSTLQEQLRLKTLADLPTIHFSVSGRIKSIASAAKKVDKKGIERLSDILGFRIVIDTNSEVDSIAKLRSFNEKTKTQALDKNESERVKKDYEKALETLYIFNSALTEISRKENWEEIENDYDDYVKKPKENGYQAVQRSFIFKSGNRKVPFEIQIQTRGMYEWATWGGASHIKYKESVQQNGDQNGFKTNSLDLFKDILAKLKNSYYGFKRVRGYLEGPYEITPVNQKPCKIIDLAYAIDPKWAEYGAQFFVTKNNSAREKECTVGTPLDNGDILKVVTSPSIKVTPERIALCSTLSARRFLREQLFKQKRLDVNEVRSKGERIFQGLINSFLESICTLKNLTRKNIDVKVLNNVILNSCNLFEKSEIYEELYLGNENITNLIEYSVVIIEKEKEQFKVISKNKRVMEGVLKSLFNNNKIEELELNKDKNLCTLSVKGKDFTNNDINKILEKLEQEDIILEYATCINYPKTFSISALTKKTTDETLETIYETLTQKYISHVNYLSIKKSIDNKMEIILKLDGTSKEKVKEISALLSKKLNLKNLKLLT